jgi:hypothetical protein
MSRVSRGVLIGLTLAALAGGARAEVAPAAEPDPQAEGRYRQGQVRFDGEWITVEQLFEKYRATQGDMADLLERGRNVSRGLDEFNYELHKIRGTYRDKEQPIRRQMAQARADMREANRALRARPPAKPRKVSPPSRPNRSFYSDDDDYERARDRWEDEKERVDRENEQREEEYRKRLAEYREAKDKAEEQIRKAEDVIEECEAELEALEKQQAEEEAPWIEKRQEVVDNVNSLKREASALIARAGVMEDEFRSVPEEALFKAGVVEWKGTFHTVEQLEAHLAESQAEIDRIRDDLKAQAERAGRSFPEDWRHPKQDELDALAALLERAKASR